MKKINNNWIKKFSYPLIISGPCSAENEKQVLNIAKDLNKSYVEVFRAGIWKPRTKPGMFEGKEEEGLKWMVKAKKKYNLLLATEVANKNHVKLALKYKIDILWIGARSTCNPFTIQEISDSLKNSKNIILIKNPLNLDIELWIGAIERFIKNNIYNIGIIHRGFSIYKSKKYRNQPCWLEVLKLKEKFPNIPILCDPSHITGDSNKIYEVSKKAINFGYDGLMIETHNNPKKALSDANQQITPTQLTEILSKILLKKKIQKKYINTLNIYRNNINEIDENIIYLLKNRFISSNKIGEIKNKYNLNIIQKDIMLKQKNKYKEICKILNLDELLIQKIFDEIHKKSIELQLNKKKINTKIKK
ncbi:MAG: bifunctional 3-deoxy-7-phosphoheptulonate synthase/chorismate mutase type II [Candidatus Shikimatogenerans bostrichidophilus]|nr:MAG: bifunctional 3-deoxy-7-phosphoheptulonate synthase/chorismate mutase type II [Candidatus Shikimatogenerans bostrichidophilus]